MSFDFEAAARYFESPKPPDPAEVSASCNDLVSAYNLAVPPPRGWATLKDPANGWAYLKELNDDDSPRHEFIITLGVVPEGGRLQTEVVIKYLRKRSLTASGWAELWDSYRQLRETGVSTRQDVVVKHPFDDPESRIVGSPAVEYLGECKPLGAEEHQDLRRLAAELRYVFRQASEPFVPPAPAGLPLESLSDFRPADEPANPPSS